MAKTITKLQIQLRHDLASAWTSANPVLAAGEVGIETDSHKLKLGDGTTAWNDLPYVSDAADHAAEADHATNADHATEADHAANADHATLADAASKVTQKLTINGTEYDGSAAQSLTLSTPTEVTEAIAEAIKVNVTDKLAVASGIATLGPDGFIPSAQLPSYVDDIVEYENVEAFPKTGDKAKIYIATDTGSVYRWSGSGYVEISNGAGVADAATKLATPRNFSIAGDVTAAAVAFDGTGDVALQAVLPAVGTAGTYGSATEVAKITTDDKGRVSAVTNVKITPAFADLTGVPENVKNAAAFDPDKGIKLDSADKVLATWGEDDGAASITGTQYTGNAASADKVNHKLTIGSQQYDGSADITVDTSVFGDVLLGEDNTFTGANTFTQAITLGTTGKLSETDYTGKAATAGVADSATVAGSAAKLTTPVNINGVPFDGSASINVEAEIKEPADGIYTFDCGGATD